MEFNMRVTNGGELELADGPTAMDGLMTDDVLVSWLMNLEQEDAAAELLDERHIRAVRREERLAASA